MKTTATDLLKKLPAPFRGTLFEAAKLLDESFNGRVKPLYIEMFSGFCVGVGLIALLTGSGIRGSILLLSAPLLYLLGAALFEYQNRNVKKTTNKD